eukprot:TRINITY_DN905_c0_g5_i1.p1 TRINITY_DN905_c0_g5~~TRINITY_DN905_c0_g5_i1.p1  ORF type:complete len:1249 (+),score=355.34 TRINITY_DN905_c0_g5_i1:53-3748(+)
MEEGVSDADAAFVQQAQQGSISEATKLQACLEQLHGQGHSRVECVKAFLHSVLAKLGEPLPPSPQAERPLQRASLGRVSPPRECRDRDPRYSLRASPSGGMLSPMLSRLPSDILKETAGSLQQLLDAGLTRVDDVPWCCGALAQLTRSRRDSARLTLQRRRSSADVRRSQRDLLAAMAPHDPPVQALPRYEYHDDQEKAFEGDYEVVDCQLCQEMVIEDAFTPHWANGISPPTAGLRTSPPPSFILPLDGDHSSAAPVTPGPETPPAGLAHLQPQQQRARENSLLGLESPTQDPMNMSRSLGRSLSRSLALSRNGSVASAAPHVVKETGSVNKTLSNVGQKMINEYVVVKDLGKGSYGKVKLAQHVLGGLYAIKIVNKGSRRMVDSGSSLYDALLEEIAVMKRLNHPHVCALHEVINDVASSKVYLIIDYCSKGTAYTTAASRQPPLAIPVLKRYFIGTAQGLRYLHANNIVHRDIKPDNILIDENDVPRLTDFGMSEMTERGDETSTQTSTDTKGTPAFLAPEELSGQGTPDGKLCDIWSVGVSFYLMGFGALPFNGDTFPELSRSILTDTPDFTPAVPDQNTPFRESPATTPRGDDAAGEHDCFVNLLEGLLRKQPRVRLGAAKGCAELLLHEFVVGTEGAEVDDDYEDLRAAAVSEEEQRAAVARGVDIKLNIADTVQQVMQVRKSISRFKQLRVNSVAGRCESPVDNNSGRPSSNSTPRYRPTPPPDTVSEPPTITETPALAPATTSPQKLAVGGDASRPLVTSSHSQTSFCRSERTEDDSDDSENLLMSYGSNPLPPAWSQEREETERRVSTFSVHRGARRKSSGLGRRGSQMSSSRQRRSFRTEEEMLAEQGDADSDAEQWRSAVATAIDDDRETLLLNCMSFPQHILPEMVCTPPLTTSLTTLRVNLSSLVGLSDAIGDLSSLTELNLAHNAIAALPDTIGRLSHLEVLIVNNNHLTELPGGVGDLHRLKVVNLDYNRLPAVPDALLRLPMLQSCYLASNDAITTLPEGICNWRDCQLTVTNKPSVMNSWQDLRAGCPSLGVTVQWNKLYPDMVERGVYLGSLRTAQSATILKELGITRIVTCGKGLVVLDPLPDGLEQIEILVDDMLDQKLTPYFRDVADYIAQQLDSNQSILVHCFAGLSRSASFLTAYYMLKRSMTFKEAITLVKSARPACNPNATFRNELIDLEETLYGTRLNPDDVENAPNGPVDTNRRASRSCRASFV